jgi:hypothetical protein
VIVFINNSHYKINDIALNQPLIKRIKSKLQVAINTNPPTHPVKMNAKEERAINLEMHKLKRVNNEFTLKNAALEAECARLRAVIKQESEKHSAIMQQHNDAMDAERKKTHTLQVELEQERDTSNAISANYAHTQFIYNLDFKDKRVAMYSHFSEHEDVESYNMLSLECIEHYFDYIIVLTNCPNKWKLHSPNYNKCHLLAYNLKSDFRNYGLFIMQTAKTLIHAARLCFMNDSFVIVDVSAFGSCMKRLFEANGSHDFAGLTSSHEYTFHIQSYFMCFNAAAVPGILSYFETHTLPANHQAAISQYELGITSHLIDSGLSSFAVVSNNEMQFPMNTTCCKWATVLQEVGIIKRQHFFKKYAYVAMTDADIALIAEKYSYNKHFIHFLKYHSIAS